MRILIELLIAVAIAAVFFFAGYNAGWRDAVELVRSFGGSCDKR